MSEILYLKPEKNVRTYNRVLTLGEAVVTGFSVRFPNFVSLKIEPYGKKKIQRVVLHQA